MRISASFQLISVYWSLLHSILAHAGKPCHLEPGAIVFVIDEAGRLIDGPRVKGGLTLFVLPMRLKSAQVTGFSRRN